MTKAQEREVERIRRMAERSLFFGTDKSKYEFKTWEVNENEFFVEVRLETGLKGDEGTMAEVFGREFAQLFIGKKGGVTYFKTIRDKDGHYVRSSQRRLGSHGILQAVLDQK